jgi:hypothetical protein
MLPPPGLNAPDLVGAAKVVAVAVFAGPPLLAGPLAGLPTGRFGTVALAIFGPRIGGEEPVAAAAFAPGSRAAHRAGHFGNAPPERKLKSRAGRRPRRKKEGEF